MTFIDSSGVRFWEMTPQHALVSGGTTENSVLAKANAQYVVYVRDNASVTLNLAGLTHPASYRTYVPTTGAWGAPIAVTGGATWTFTRPSGAEDWVILVEADSAAGPAPSPPPADTSATPTTGPLAKATNLRVTRPSATSVEPRFVDNATEETHYKIWRDDTKAGPYTALGPFAFPLGAEAR
jgi:hypothetical protein